VAGVDGDGLVRTFELAGDATIMARYMGQVAVFRALVPLGKAIAKYPDFPTKNYIDELALTRWQKLGLVPSELCTEGEFIRRYRLDEPEFPHHSTANQFFTEAQFEAYRSLGEHVGDKLFLPAIVGPAMSHPSADIRLENWFLAIGKNLLSPLR